MIEGKSVLAIITARGGSKGLPRKNVRLLKGKPLIAWTIEVAQGSLLIDRLVVSSEDPEVLDAARKFGCEVPFVRPAELARDDTPGIAPVRHAIAQLPYHDYTVLLQPTSPLRVTEDIDGCIRRCHEAQADACVSVVAASKPPQWMFTRGDDDVIQPFIDASQLERRRQDFPSLVVPNGAVYVARTAWLLAGRTFFEGRVVCYEMPLERSVDVDTDWDWFVLSRIVGELDVPH